MKINYLFFLTVVLLISIQAAGQNSYYKGYYKTSNAASVGIQVVDGGKTTNTRICQVKENGRIQTYTPYEVIEYGINRDKIYVSKNIQLADSLQRVFLQQLVKGKLNLYFYKDAKTSTYFLGKDSSLIIALPKKSDEKDDKSFRGILSDISTDCDNIHSNVRFVTYRKNALVKFTKQYNSCIRKPFPFAKFGLMAGYNAAMPFTPSNMRIEELSLFNFKYEGSLIAGVFLDHPLFMTNVSLHTEVYYSEFKCAYNFQDANNDIDLLINSASFSIPVLIRYNYQGMKLSPFINLGAVYSNNYKNDGTLYWSITDDNQIYIKEPVESSYLSGSQVGFSFGGGLQLKITQRNHIFVEFRMNRKYGLTSKVLYNIKELQFLTGINF